MKNKIKLLLILFLTCSISAYSYDTQQLERDFNEIVKIGNRVYKSSIKASRVISDVLVKDGKPNDSISVSEVSVVQTELTTADNDKIELQASEMQAGNLDEFMPKPNNFNTLALEKLVSGKKRGRKQPSQAKPVAVSRPKRNDKKLVAKVFPDHAAIEGLIATTNSTTAKPDALNGDSAKLRELCTAMFNKLCKRGETAARIKFYELLSRPANKKVRLYFSGIAALITGFSEFDREDSVKNLKKMVPQLQNEAKTAAKAIDWDFAVAIEKMPKAKSSLMKSIDHSKLFWHSGTFTVTSTKGKKSSNAKQAFWSNSKDDGKLSTNYWQESWTHMWGDMADQLQGSFDKGTQYGEKAGSFIGTATGIGKAFGKMAAEKTAKNIVNQVKEYAKDSFKGLFDVTPDPYSIVGHYAGGAIGTLGGAIGNTTGWVVGTLESIAAQRSKKASRSAGKKGKAPTPADEKVKLF